MATCESGTISFGGYDYTREDLAIFVVLFDIASCVMIMIFGWALNRAQHIYVKKFMMSTIEMNDFTVRVKNLPLPSRYEAKDIMLKVLLYEHFSRLIKFLKNDQSGEWDEIFGAIKVREARKKRELNPVID